MEHKLCVACEQRLPIYKFNRHAKTPDCLTKRCRECMAAAPRQVSARTKAQEALYRAKHRERTRQQVAANARALRQQVFDHYGQQCACCGEVRYEFLAIDHVDGGGSAHRKQIKRTIDRWLVQNGFPAGFRVLCHNCNWSRWRYGECPHERERRT